MRKVLPSFIKQIIRFLYYRQERVRVFREPGIRRIQDKEIKRHNPTANKLVLFMIQGADYETGIDKISGGIISIVSLCEESRKLSEIHNSEVLLCTFPGQYLLVKHTQFKNETTVFRYDQMEKYFPKVNEVIIHLPEYLCEHFVMLTNNGNIEWLRKMNSLHINILNQNIRFMPQISVINELKRIATRVTSTTAHQQYCTPYYRDLYQIPLHKFSVWISPEKYHFKSFAEKENLMVVSPDGHPAKQEVLDKLNSVPNLRVQIIKNLTYEEYKELISRAKWSLTFGEGLDGYLIEPVFSGAVGFAVYNEEFFTADFKELKTIYSSIEQLSDNIISDIQQLNDITKFQISQQLQFNVCAFH